MALHPVIFPVGTKYGTDQKSERAGEILLLWEQGFRQGSRVTRKTSTWTLRQLMKKGTLQAGAMLLSERLLCERFNLSDHSLYSTLEENYGIHLARCVEDISAAHPTRAQKKLLRIPRGIPVLVIKRKTYTQNETPVEIVVAANRADLYSAIVQSFRRPKDSQTLGKR